MWKKYSDLTFHALYLIENLTFYLIREPLSEL